MLAILSTLDGQEAEEGVSIDSFGMKVLRAAGSALAGSAALAAG